MNLKITLRGVVTLATLAAPMLATPGVHAAPGDERLAERVRGNLVSAISGMQRSGVVITKVEGGKIYFRKGAGSDALCVPKSSPKLTAQGTVTGGLSDTLDLTSQAVALLVTNSKASPPVKTPIEVDPTPPQQNNCRPRGARPSGGPSALAASAPQAATK